MLYMQSRDKTIVMSMLELLDKINRYTKNFSNSNEFYDNEIKFDAVLMNFVILGEMVSKLSDDFKSKNNHIEWKDVKAFRNLIAHNYFGINADEVWDIVQFDLPDLKTKLDEF